MIANALAGKPLPVYGDGQQVRDWLYVGDHCAAIRAVLERGRPGETYNIGGNAEMTNLDVVRTLCRLLGELAPGRDYAEPDRLRQGPARPRPPLRDRRDEDPRASSAGRRPRPSRRDSRGPSAGTSTTAAWLDAVTSGEYQRWIDLNYAGARAAA